MALARLTRTAERAAKAGVKRLIGQRPGAAVSYSSAGEDMIVRHLLGTTAGRGFYVDVGAGHPTIGSNTYHFYTIGWRGITIEPQAALVEEHRKVRPRDRVFDCAVATSSGRRTLIIPRGGSTMAGFAPRYGADDAESVDVLTMPLSTILSGPTPAGEDERISFLSVDVESAELDVLQSNDWDRFRPMIACVETEAGSSAVADFLIEHEYDIVATNSIIIGEVTEVFAADRRFDWSSTQNW